MIIAPEGLHRFYVEGFSGRVGASWMTKERRLEDIDDYLEYLNGIFEHYVKARLEKNNNIKVYLLGFSQGSATASRWLLEDPNRFEGLILYAGMLPPDLDPGKIDHQTWPMTFLVHDPTDKFHHSEHFQHQLSWLDQNQIPYTPVQTNSGHKITPESLKELLNHLA